MLQNKELTSPLMKFSKPIIAETRRMHKERNMLIASTSLIVIY